MLFEPLQNSRVPSSPRVITPRHRYCMEPSTPLSSSIDFPVFPLYDFLFCSARFLVGLRGLQCLACPYHRAASLLLLLTPPTTSSPARVKTAASAGPCVDPCCFALPLKAQPGGFLTFRATSAFTFVTGPMTLLTIRKKVFFREASEFDFPPSPLSSTRFDFYLGWSILPQAVYTVTRLAFPGLQPDVRICRSGSRRRLRNRLAIACDAGCTFWKTTWEFVRLFPPISLFCRSLLASPSTKAPYRPRSYPFRR